MLILIVLPPQMTWWSCGGTDLGRGNITWLVMIFAFRVLSHPFLILSCIFSPFYPFLWEMTQNETQTFKTRCLNGANEVSSNMYAMFIIIIIIISIII